MPWTAADLIVEVRDILQDREATRYTDARILRATMQVIAQVRLTRPDYFHDRLREPLPLFFFPVSAGSPGTEPAFDPKMTIPLPEMIRALVTTYCAGWVELADDQFTDDSRAIGLMTALGRALGPNPYAKAGQA